MLIEALATQLGALLADKNKKIVTAESCTGGWVSQAITQVAGSSLWFDRTYVTYSNDAKRQMLGVKQRTLSKHGAVSQAVVEEMAVGALKKSEADFSVAISGIAGPDGGTERIAGGAGTWAGRRPRRGGRSGMARNRRLNAARARRARWWRRRRSRRRETSAIGSGTSTDARVCTTTTQSVSL